MALGAKTLICFVVAIVLSAAAVEEARAALTLSGTVPEGGSVVVIPSNNQDGVTGVLKFKFSYPGANNGLYLRFCIGPASSPCGPNAVYAVNVPAGQERIAIVGANAFRNNILWVATPHNARQFIVTVE